MARPWADRRGMGLSSWSTRGARGGRGVEEVQRRDIGWPLRRLRVPEAVDPEFAAVFERFDHVGPQRKKSPNEVRRLVILNILYKS